MHWPLAQLSFWFLSPQLAPSSLYLLSGQELEVPLQVSAMSHSPVLARQTVSAEANWHLLQQLSFESSHTALSLNLQVLASQQELSLQLSSSPQSHSSSPSTIPLPHWLPLMVTTPRLSDRQEDLMLFLPMAEQILPMVHSENLVIEFLAYGFIMYSALALQVDELNGQH